MWLSRTKLITAALVLFTLVGSGTAWLSTRGAADENSQPGTAPTPAERRAEAPPNQALAFAAFPDAAAEGVNVPRVVQVQPANGATDVEPTTELRIRFDRPVNKTRVSLAWKPGPAGFRPRGEVQYVEATHEFIVPVHVSPGHKHELTVRVGGAFADDKKGYTWSFTARKPAAKEGKPPRSTAIIPAPDTEIALITPLEVTFDQPMDPLAYGLAEPGTGEFDIRSFRPELLGVPDYDAEKHRFTLLLRLPPNWNGELRLEHFRNKDGVEIAPVTLRYRTLRAMLSEATLKYVEEAGKSAELQRLVERVRQARRDLRSVSEEASWAVSSYASSPDWQHSLDVWGSRFLMQGRDQFLGVIDGTMDMPFRIGSDGKTCWFRGKNERVSIPAKDMHDKYVLFCDAFDAFRPADAAAIIKERKLELLRETACRGRRCYRVRSWGADYLFKDFLSIRDWTIDATTLLPVRIDMTGTATSTISYTHSRINEAIPDKEFAPETGTDLKIVDAEPLAEGYDRRFLSVNDGSAGRMSVRWGMKGPKGSSSAGLN